MMNVLTGWLCSVLYQWNWKHVTSYRRTSSVWSVTINNNSAGILASLIRALVGGWPSPLVATILLTFKMLLLQQVDDGTVVCL